jgi:hypothetical protein
MSMKPTVIKSMLLGMLTTLAACGGPSTSSTPSLPKYDAAYSVALDGQISNGQLISPSNDPQQAAAYVQQQLYYTIGELNGINGGAPDMRRTQIQVGAITPRADGLFDVHYTATMLIAWPKEVQIQQNLLLILPARGDAQGLRNFFSSYGSDESTTKLCLDDAAHEVAQSVLWYYYRPFKASCPLRGVSTDQIGKVVRQSISLKVSAENTNGKYPEYQKVWEDGRLVVTAIFGKYEAGAIDDGDAGISAYRQLYFDLLNTYGRPLSSNLPNGAYPSAQFNDVRLTFQTVSGPLDVAIFLVDGIQQVDQAFRLKYNQRTEISDFVSYNGHSGLGANIQALARMGHFVAGQYQLFMVNGCDTFAYVDDALRDAHQAVNPGAGPNKYFDMITNAMPSLFAMNSRSNMAVINGLVFKQQTYRQILAGFDISQRPGVTGEQDNAWPAPF